MASASHLVFRSARSVGVDAVLRRLRPGAVVLCYHNIVETAERGADRSLHLPISDFREQVAWLTRHFSVVSLDELQARAKAGRSLRGLAAITFDDAYRGTIQHGLGRLRALGVPATVFVPSDAPSSERGFWWDLIESKASESEQGRQQLLETLKGNRSAILDAFPSPQSAVLHPDCLPATWEDLASAQSDVVRFEAHSVSHPTLPRLDDHALQHELQQAADSIESKLGRRPRWVAYPYGRWDARVAAATVLAGYAGGFTLDSRDVTSSSDWSHAPRLNIPAGITLDAFAAWVSGFAHWRASRS